VGTKTGLNKDNGIRVCDAV